MTLRGKAHPVYMYTACMDTGEVMVNDTIVSHSALLSLLIVKGTCFKEHGIVKPETYNLLNVINKVERKSKSRVINKMKHFSFWKCAAI